MLARIQRVLKRRKLRPVVSVLPWALTRSYGASDEYSFGQISRASEKLKLKPGLLPYALAAYCQPQELIAWRKMSEADIAHHRDELYQLFYLTKESFNVEDIRRMRIRQSWNAAAPSIGVESYGTGHSGGSSD